MLQCKRSHLLAEALILQWRKSLSGPYLYNHATTKLAISSNEMSRISCQKHKIGSLLLSSRYKTNYIKTCSFLHAHFSGTMKVVKNLSRKAYGETHNYGKDIYCRYTLELPLWGNSNVYQIYVLLKIRKLVLSLHLNLVTCRGYHVHCLCLF